MKTKKKKSVQFTHTVEYVPNQEISVEKIYNKEKNELVHIEEESGNGNFCLQKRFFDFNRIAQIQILQEYQRIDSTGSTVWNASIVLCFYLTKQTEWKGSAIELGSGLGLVSITAANMGLQVLATEGCQQVLELLKKNIQLNNLCNVVNVQHLNWNEPLTFHSLCPHDYIFASDIFFDFDGLGYDGLVQTIVHLSNLKTVIILSYRKRRPLQEAHLFKSLRKYFCVDEVFKRFDGCNR